jgi:hypothetical protein
VHTFERHSFEKVPPFSGIVSDRPPNDVVEDTNLLIPVGYLIGSVVFL